MELRNWPNLIRHAWQPRELDCERFRPVLNRHNDTDDKHRRNRIANPPRTCLRSIELRQCRTLQQLLSFSGGRGSRSCSCPWLSGTQMLLVTVRWVSGKMAAKYFSPIGIPLLSQRKCLVHKCACWHFFLLIWDKSTLCLLRQKPLVNKSDQGIYHHTGPMT